MQTKDYSKTYYGLPVLTVIIITDGYESSELEYSRVNSDVLKPIYIHMDWDEIIEKLKNIEEKIDKQKQLSKEDGLDFVYLPMFAPKKEAKRITKKMVDLFKEDESLKKPFRDCVAYGLSFMVKKYFKYTSEAEELLNMLEPEFKDSKLRIVAEFEAAYDKKVLELKLAEKERTIAEMQNAISENNQENKAILEKINQENKVLKAKLEENGISY